jgi:hypothetical protein
VFSPDYFVIVISVRLLQDYNCSVEYHVTHFLVHENKAKNWPEAYRDVVDRYHGSELIKMERC